MPLAESPAIDSGIAVSAGLSTVLTQSTPDNAESISVPHDDPFFTSLPTPYFILVDDEVMRVSSTESGELTVERGMLGTLASAHNGNSVVEFFSDQRGQPRTIAVGEETRSDIGAVEKAFAELIGSVFHDVNADGARGVNEPGLEEWLVYLDEDNDDERDEDEPFAMTDEFGQYQLQDVSPGDHHVKLSAPNDLWIPTSPSRHVELSAGQHVTDIDFGNLPVAGQVEGTQFSDVNGNGIQDDGELGLPGWVVFADRDDESTFVSTDVPRDIPVQGSFRSSIEVSGLRGRIVDVNVSVNVEHPKVSDLAFGIEPGDVLLFNNNNNVLGARFQQYNLRRPGSTTRGFRPMPPTTATTGLDGPLSRLNGESPNGVLEPANTQSAQPGGKTAQLVANDQNRRRQRTANSTTQSVAMVCATSTHWNPVP